MARRASVTAFLILTTFAPRGHPDLQGVRRHAGRLQGGGWGAAAAHFHRDAPRAAAAHAHLAGRGGGGKEKEDVAILSSGDSAPWRGRDRSPPSSPDGQSGAHSLRGAGDLLHRVTCFVSYLICGPPSPSGGSSAWTGLAVLNRVIGLIIGAIAVQFMFDGSRTPSRALVKKRIHPQSAQSTQRKMLFFKRKPLRALRALRLICSCLFLGCAFAFRDCRDLSACLGI